MAQQTLNVGSNANDGTGDTLRSAMQKVNTMFTELYLSPLTGGALSFSGNEISATRTNEDLVFKPSGTGAISFPAIRINDNNIEGTRSNEDLILRANGSGSLVVDGIGIAGTSITAIDSSIVNINENLIVDGSLTTTGNVTVSGTVSSTTGSVIGTITLANGSITDSTGAISFGNENITTTGTFSAETGSVIGNLTFADGSITDSSGEISFVNENLTTTGTLDTSGLATLGTMTVSGVSSFADTTTIDNLTFDDNIIASSSNADINLTPGGTGVVNVSNLTIDSSINLTDNVIKVIRSNDDFKLSANGTGSVQISKVDMNEGTVDNTVIGATTPAAASFSTVSITVPNVTADKVNITDNKIKATDTDANLVISANGSGNVLINGFTFPNTVTAGQVIKTNASKVLSTVVFPFVVTDTDVEDATVTITGNSSAQVINSFALATYRSVKYHIQISDATADRYTLIEANVTHDGTNAYVSTFGAATNGDGDGSTIYDSVDLSADIDSGNVRLLGTVNNTNNQVIKLVRRVIKV